MGDTQDLSMLPLHVRVTHHGLRLDVWRLYDADGSYVGAFAPYEVRRLCELMETGISRSDSIVQVYADRQPVYSL